MTVPDEFPPCLDQFEVIVIEPRDYLVGMQFVDLPGFFFQVTTRMSIIDLGR